jgi:alpha-L-fucosidase
MPKPKLPVETVLPRRLRFSPADFRFTKGANGSIYAIELAIPKPGSHIRINSLGLRSGLLTSPIQSVTMLGSTRKLVWKQGAGGLEITIPSQISSRIAVVFEVK